MLIRIIKAGMIGVAAIFALRVLAVLLVPGRGSGKGMEFLAFGWIKFLQRTLPNVTVNWSGILMLVLCSSVIVVGMHWLGKSLHRAANPETSQPWRWRWTVALFASLWLTFGIVIGASGAARHIRWLVAFDEPFYKERINYHVDMRMTTLELRYLLEQSELDSRGLHDRLVMTMSRRAWPLGVVDRYQYIFLNNASNHIESALVIPRDPEAQRRFGFMVSSKPDERIPIEQLPSYILSK